MPDIKQFTPPFEVGHVPWLSRKTAPVGPAVPVVTESSGARVISVPGVYSVSHIIEGPEKLFIVDTGSVTDIPYLEKAVKWIGKPVAYFMPSHLHFDHMMGLNDAARHFRAGVALGKPAFDVTAKAESPRFPLTKSLIHFFIPWIWQGLPGARKADLQGGFRFGFPWSTNPFTAPVVSLDEGDSVPDLDEGWTLLFTPGHSNECVSLWHEETGFLVCGDSIRNFEGGEWNPILTDPQTYLETIARFKQLNVNAIFCAHGPVINGTNLIPRISNKYLMDK